MYINTFNEAMKRRFGKKMYRLSLDYSFGCPNRDGTAGYGGCIFCSSSGAGNFSGRGDTLESKIISAKERIKSKTDESTGFIAYFQSYTNTYAPKEVLEKLFTEAARRTDIEAISIATRPDCLPCDIIDLLAEVNKIKPVWVELGLQTADDKTAKAINRCYPTALYDSAVLKLHENNIEVITHVIIGLPSETTEDIKNTIRHIVKMKTDGVKLHLLHVLKNTKLEQMYNANEFDTLSLEEYTNILCEIIPMLPAETVIHRFTGDGDKKELVAPLWSADKKRTLNYINKAFKDSNIRQGSSAAFSEGGE